MQRRDFLTTAAISSSLLATNGLRAESKADILGSAKQGLADVGIARGSSMEDAVRQAVKLSGGMDFIQPGQNVLIKPNCTGAAKNPTTTHPEVLYAVIKLVNERGPKRIYVSDRSFSALAFFGNDMNAAEHRPRTVEVMKSVGHLGAIEQAKAELKAPVVAIGFEDANQEWEYLGKPKDTPNWRKIDPTKRFACCHCSSLIHPPKDPAAKTCDCPKCNATVKVPKQTLWPNGYELAEILFAVDHVINVPVIKTHFQAWFTMALKSYVGMSHHRSRLEFHRTYKGNNDLSDQTGRKSKRRRGVKQDPQAEEAEVFPLVGRVAEFNLGFKPTLNILDGTQSFVFGGPSHGDTASAKLIVASRDRIAADVAGVGVLKSLGCEERLMSRSVWNLPFIKHAVNIGVGIDGPARLNLKSSGIPEIDKIKEMMV